VAAGILIVGSGMAAARLLEELAERGCAEPITVVGAEPDASYNRIQLASVLCGSVRADQIALLDPDWYRRHGVRLILNDAVAAIDPADRVATTAAGRRLRFDRLVFATGARAHVPAAPGTDARGVLTFRSLTDLRNIRAAATSGAPAVVIGGGLLGLEAAHGLASLGLDVTVVHRHAGLMNRQLDREGGEVLQRLLERRGIRFAMGAAPEAFDALDAHVSAVRLDSGLRLRARLVVLAAGIDPECGLARSAGIRCGRAIVVDARMRTSAEEVYALGECCEFRGQTVGLVAPAWRQAAVLADVLTGHPTATYEHADAPAVLKVSGIEVFAAGARVTPPDAEEQVLRDEVSGIYRRLVLHRGRLVGAVLVGDRSGSSWYGDLIARGQDVSELRGSLMFGAAFGPAAIAA
jgi:nitrite reductase (NADH) large subunit